MHPWLDRRFHIQERGSTVGREFRGAVATFLTMAYILFVNPGILAAAGIPFNAALAATALAAGLSCILMGLYGNFPLALASGMGLNAIVAFTIAKAAGSWQAAMGLVVLDGIIMLILVLLGMREAMMRAIPMDLRRAIGVGIGLFIAFIGAVNARLVTVAPGSFFVWRAFENPLKGPALPPVQAGSLAHPEALIALVGLILISVLLARKVQGALIIGIIFCTVIALFLGVAKLPHEFTAPDFSTLGQADVWAVLKNPRLYPLLLALILVDFFDTLGTTTAIAEQGNLEDSAGEIPRLKQILIVDSIAASIGGFCGASSVTSYIESAAGVAEGARTGLHSVFVGVFFLLAIFAAPLAGIVPAAATAPALIIVGFLMAGQIMRIDFTNLETGIPAFITLAMLPFTYSIPHGVGYGFITYVAIKVLIGKFKDVHPLMYGAATLFAAYFALG
jgi:AGZA family xanthine/uracil permease-like MFS transporter